MTKPNLMPNHRSDLQERGPLRRWKVEDRNKRKD